MIYLIYLSELLDQYYNNLTLPLCMCVCFVDKYFYWTWILFTFCQNANTAQLFFYSLAAAQCFTMTFTMAALFQLFALSYFCCLLNQSTTLAQTEIYQGLFFCLEVWCAQRLNPNDNDYWATISSTKNQVC